MIDETKIQRLRDPKFTCHCVHVPVLLDDMEALWKVARAAQNVEDMLEVNPRLGAHSQIVCQKAIDDFREALAALPERKE